MELTASWIVQCMRHHPRLYRIITSVSVLKSTVDIVSWTRFMLSLIKGTISSSNYVYIASNDNIVACTPEE
jgi:hypothetical protein